MALNSAATSLRVRCTAFCLRLGVPLVGVILFTLGLLGLLSFGLLPVLESLHMRAWLAVPAQLEAVSVRPHATPLLPPFDTLEVVYRYELDGVQRSGRRYDVHDGRALASDAGMIAGQLRTEGKLRVWVDPDEPANAVIRRDPRWGVIVFALPALAMMVAGGLMLFVGMVAWNGRGALAPRPASRA